MTSVAVLERITVVTPLAVRFRDEATGAFVSDALAVHVRPAWDPERRTWGVRNASSIFVFRNLPSLGDVERGAGDAAFWSSQAAIFDFVLEVRDLAGRFLPFQLPIKLPQRRLLGIALTSPPASPLAVQTGSEEGYLPLYSAASRAVPDGLGVLRGELVDATTGGPAAWALVEAKAGEQRLVTGMADREGRIMLPLFYPKPVIVLGSPGTPNTPLTAQTWPVDVTIRYRPRQPVPEIPDLIDVLTQPAAGAWLASSPATPFTRGTLGFGRELVLPRLLITP